MDDDAMRRAYDRACDEAGYAGGFRWAWDEMPADEKLGFATFARALEGYCPAARGDETAGALARLLSCLEREPYRSKVEWSTATMRAIQEADAVLAARLRDGDDR